MRTYPRRQVLVAIAAALTLSRPAVAQERDIVVIGGWLFTSTATTAFAIPASSFAPASSCASAATSRSPRRTPSESRRRHARRSFPDCSISTRTTRSSCSTPAARTKPPRIRRCFSRTASRRRSRRARWIRTSCATLRIRIENGARARAATAQLRPVLRHRASGLGSRHHRAADLRRSGPLGGAWRQGIQGEGHHARRAARAHRARAFHGLTVTGHLDSGNRNSVNPRDAILMGIDRIEHFMGGDAFTADKSAYASYEHMTFDTPEFKRIAAAVQAAARVLRRDAQRVRLLRKEGSRRLHVFRRREDVPHAVHARRHRRASAAAR